MSIEKFLRVHSISSMTAARSMPVLLTARLSRVERVPGV
jgi:hypothetical protein